MAQNKRSVEIEIAIEGELYARRIQRQPQWSSDTGGRRGMAIAVRQSVGAFAMCVLEAAKDWQDQLLAGVPGQASPRRRWNSTSTGGAAR